MSAKNLAEARALVERYRTVTLEEVEGACAYLNPAQYLTGFGRQWTCTLCRAAHGCSECVWGPKAACTKTEGFSDIAWADITRIPRALLAAFRTRADVLERRIHECEESR